MMFSLQYDINYGIDKRCGWSISYHGVSEIEFEKHLLIALIKFFIKRIKRW